MRGTVKITQDKVVRRKRKKALWMAAFFLFFLGLTFFGMAWLSQAGFWRIGQVDVTGAQVLSGPAIEAKAEKMLVGNYWGLFSRANAMLYPKGEIEAFVRSLPAVKSVDVSLSSLRSARIDIVERSESAEWCAGDSTSTDCYAADADGYLYAPTATSTAVVYRGPLSASSTQALGSQLMDAEDFHHTQFFISQVKALAVNPTEVVMGEAGYMTIVLRQGGRLIVNTADDLSLVLANLQALLEDKALVPSVPEFLAKLDYLRLDSGNKLFYKLRT